MTGKLYRHRRRTGTSAIRAITTSWRPRVDVEGMDTRCSVALYAVVDPTTAAGTVAFTDNNTPILDCGSRPLSDGVAICVTTFTTAGGHTINAVYSGDGMHAGSSASAPLTVTSTPTLFQLLLGHLIAYAHTIHAFGL